MSKGIRLLLGLIVVLTAPLAGQVGHDPARSPYRDVEHGSFMVASGGYFFGDGGQVGVAPHDGPVAGLGVTFLSNKPLQFGAGVFWGPMQRNILDLGLPAGQRVIKSVDHNVVWVDVNLHFNFTGNKSWHRLAPFAGVATGVAFTSNVPDDPTVFEMGTKFTFTPLIGTRIFLARRLHLQVEGRFQFWQIKYGEMYYQGDEPVITQGRRNEWDVTPWVNVGLGYAVAWPF
jgi:hypothetical protein